MTQTRNEVGTEVRIHSSDFTDPLEKAIIDVMAYSKKARMSPKSTLGRGKGARVGKRSAPVVRVTKGALTKAVKAVIARQAEVKYVASTNEDQVQVPTTCLIPTSLRPVLPKQAQGVGPSNRIGDQIRGAHGYVDLTFSLMDNYSPSGNYVVKVFQMTSKSIKDGQYIPSLSSSTLLDVGDGSTTDWNPASTDVVILSQMPVSNSNFTVQSIKTMNLVKNSGTMNGDASTPPPAPNGGFAGTHASCRLYWKHDAPLKYETSSGAANTVYPTNYCPVYTYVAYSVDGQDLLEEPLAPIIVTSRSHMWFTDA